jgi:NADH-quinone oxidoreductase subunit L
MGALRKKIPITFWTFVVGWLAISGIPPFAGFFSKDEILTKAYETGNTAVWILGVSGAVLTAFYMSRLIFVTFFGESRVEHHTAEHIHESPAVMTVPLMILALLTLVGGFAFDVEGFLSPLFGTQEHLTANYYHSLPESILILISVTAGLLGIFIALLMYIWKKINPDALSKNFIYKLFFNKYYVDEIYDTIFIRPIKNGSIYLWKKFDVLVVDGAINGIAKLVGIVSELIRKVQTGYVMNYVLTFTIGVAIIIGYYLLR